MNKKKETCPFARSDDPRRVECWEPCPVCGALGSDPIETITEKCNKATEEG